MRFLRYTAIISAAMCLMTAASCEHKSSSSQAAATAGGEETTAAEVQTDAAEATTEKSQDEAAEDIYQSIKDAQVSNDKPDTGTAGDLITPGEDDEEAKLGDYRVCEDGIKIYYDESEYPQELVLTLKEYFKSFAACSYTDYTKCVYPSYLEKMDAYLQKEYGYDLRKSFAKQCAGLESKSGGKYTISRVKIEPHGKSAAEEAATMETEEGVVVQPVTENDPVKNIENFFGNYTDALGSDYYENLKKETDKIYDMDFYIMMKTEDGSEKLLVGDYEIIFAEKDGRFYTFG